MNKKNLTNEKIIKALDICYNSPCCSADCPYFNKNGRNFCKENKAFYRDLKRIVQEHAEQNVEIERLTEREKFLENAWETSRQTTKTVEIGRKACEARTAELQKQVDELETTNGQAMAYIEGLEYELKQAVKDTAKEIYGDLLKEFSLRKSCGNADVVVREMATRKGVEVE